MARKWSNLNLPGALHFVTGNLIDRVPAFTHEATCLGFFEVFRDLLEKWPAKVIAYVLLPAHISSCGWKRSSAKKIFQFSSDKRFVLETPDGDGSIHRVWQESLRPFRFGAV